jgi:hypothetical protein
MEPNGSHKPSTYHTVHTVPIWPADGAWHHPSPKWPTQLPYGSHMVPVTPICCIQLTYGPIHLLFGTIWPPHGHMAPILLLFTQLAHTTSMWQTHISHMAQVAPMAPSAWNFMYLKWYTPNCVIFYCIISAISGVIDSETSKGIKALSKALQLRF